MPDRPQLVFVRLILIVALVPLAGPVAAEDRLALDAIEVLLVKGRAPKTGYSREAFGPAWKDTDRNGCDTRMS